MQPHTRREFLKSGVRCVAGTALAASAVARSARATTPAARPNVLLISIDTLRADHLSCLGYARRTTSNLDRLAEDGIAFSNATAASPWTVPSHMSMFTGLYPSFHGLLSTKMCMADGITTLAEVLKANGYATAAYVTGPMLNAKFGYGKGFELYDDFSVTFQHKFDIFDEGVPEHTGINDLVTSPIVTQLVARWLERQAEERWSVLGGRCSGEERRAEGRERKGGGRRDEGRGEEKKVLGGGSSVVGRTEDRGEGRQVVGGGRRKPFFLFVHYWDCHYDYIPPKPYDTMFDPDYQGIIDGKDIAWRTDIAPGMDRADLNHILALYDGEIRLTDEHVGRILKKLKDAGLYDDTLIIVTSDHGEEFLEHGSVKHGHTLFQELVHVPLILKPGARNGEQKGVRCSRSAASLGSRHERQRVLGVRGAEGEGNEGRGARDEGRGGREGRRRNGGQVTAQSASHVDIMPTVLGCAGIKYDGLVHGVNLLGRRQDAEAGTRPVMFGGTSRRDMHGIRSDNRKLILDMDKHQAELFDLADDPAERKPVARCACDAGGLLPGGAPAEARELAASLAKWHVRSKEFTQKMYGDRPRVVLKLRPEVRQQLKALGYVR